MGLKGVSRSGAHRGPPFRLTDVLAFRSGAVLLDHRDPIIRNLVRGRHRLRGQKLAKPVPIFSQTLLLMGRLRLLA